MDKNLKAASLGISILGIGLSGCGNSPNQSRDVKPVSVKQLSRSFSRNYYNDGTFKELGDIAQATSQAQVNTIYNDLYRQVIKAKEQAKTHKKPLLILIGEDHYDRDALLTEVVLLDICARLNIKNAFVEHSAYQVQLAIKDAKTLLPSSGVHGFDSSLPDWANKKGQEKMVLWLRDQLTKDRPYAIQNNNYFFSVLLTEGMTITGVDIEKNSNMSVSEALSSDFMRKRETEMLKNYTRHSGLGDAIGICGSAHLKNLVEGLQDSFYILPIYTKNIDIVPVGNDQPDSSELIPYPAYTVPGRHVEPYQAAEMVGRASAKSREKMGEVKAGTAKAVTRMLSKIVNRPAP